MSPKPSPPAACKFLPLSSRLFEKLLSPLPPASTDPEAPDDSQGIGAGCPPSRNHEGPPPAAGDTGQGAAGHRRGHPARGFRAREGTSRCAPKNSESGVLELAQILLIFMGIFKIIPLHSEIDRTSRPPPTSVAAGCQPDTHSDQPGAWPGTHLPGTLPVCSNLSVISG